MSSPQSLQGAVSVQPQHIFSMFFCDTHNKHFCESYHKDLYGNFCTTVHSLNQIDAELLKLQQQIATLEGLRHQATVDQEGTKVYSKARRKEPMPLRGDCIFERTIEQATHELSEIKAHFDSLNIQRHHKLMVLMANGLYSV